MSIVFITIPGEERLAFAEQLAERTGDLYLVIVQRRRKKPLSKRIIQFWRQNRLGTIKEIWYAILLRFNPKLTKALKHFTASRGTYRNVRDLPIIEVDSVNGLGVQKMLEKISPNLLVIWGNTILKPEILNTAKRAINLHFGLCPYYRGALANQHALLRGDIEKIGATIHYISELADTGDILAILNAQPKSSPEKFFLDLNNRAVEKYLEIITDLSKGRKLSASKQDLSVGHNLLLKNWKPSLRYKLAKKLLKWEGVAT